MWKLVQTNVPLQLQKRVFQLHLPSNVKFTSFDRICEGTRSFSINKSHIIGIQTIHLTKIHQTSIKLDNGPSIIFKRTFTTPSAQTNTQQSENPSGNASTLEEILEPLRSSKRNKRWIILVALALLSLEGTIVASHYYLNNLDKNEDPKNDLELSKSMGGMYFYVMGMMGMLIGPNVSRYGLIDRLFQGYLKYPEAFFPTVESLANLASTSAYVAQRAPWAELTSRRFTMNFNNYATLIQLVFALSHVKSSGVVMASNGVVPHLIRGINLPPTNQLNMILQQLSMLSLLNLSRSEQASEYLTDVVPILYKMVVSSPDPVVKRVALDTIHNILTAETSNPEFSEKKKIQMNKAGFTPEDVEFVNSWSPLPIKDTSYTKNAAIGALGFGALWGSLRWSIASYRKGIKNSSGIFNILKVRAPLTALGSLAIWSMFHFDQSKLYEFNDPFAHAAATGAVTAASFASYWFILGVAPYSIVPAALYPILSYAISPQSPSEYRSDK